MFVTKLFLSVTSVLIAAYVFGEDANINVNDAVEYQSTSPPVPPQAPEGRRKREACTEGGNSEFTQQEKDLLVIKHNELRKKENASNEMFIKWDVSLEKLAQKRADTCEYKHGDTEFCNDTWVGQNMGITKTDYTGDASGAAYFVDLFYAEGDDYDHATGQCKAGKICGHYTQVVWHSSSKIGCAWKRCADATNLPPGWSNPVSIFVCDYSPYGNIVGQLPYASGHKCDKCDMQEDTQYMHKCNDGLCDTCSMADADCQCSFECQNQASQNPTTCLCECAEGYCGDTCHIEKGSIADVVAAYSCEYWKDLEYCESSSPYYPFMAENCAHTCGICKG